MTDLQLWWITLGAGALVVVIVAVLLSMIVWTAGRIGRTLREVWVVGQSVANNTLHLDLLRRSAVECEEIVACLAMSSEHAKRLPGDRPGGAS